MSLPDNWTLITVTGTYLKLDGTPAEGFVAFESGQIVVIDDITVVPHVIKAKLDENGSITVQLPSTNDPDLDVTGWAYIVHERIENGREDYSIFVEYNGGPIDLALVSPVVNPGTYTAMATKAQLNVLEDRVEVLEALPNITDHGGLTGLGDDDHPQYLNNARGDARYDALGAAATAQAAAIATAATDATTKANAAQAAAISTAAADATAKADAKVIDSIADADTTNAPSRNAVFDALALKADKTTTVNGHALSANVTVTASDVGLGSVTNDAQTKAAIVPNTAPSAGQLLVGNAGGTAYAPVSVSSHLALASTGAATVQAAGIADPTHAASSKATPVDADELPLVDSAASNVLKKLTWANLKATLKTYFDGLYGALSTINTWALAQTFTVAPVFTDQSGSRTALGLGTAAVKNTGTSGTTVPLLDAANTWSLEQTDTAIALPSAPSSGKLTRSVKSIAGRNLPFVTGPNGVARCIEIPEATCFRSGFQAGPGSAGTYFGTLGTNAGSASLVSGSISNKSTAMTRNIFSSVVTTTNQQVGVRGAAQYFRGNAAGIGGFFFVCRFVFHSVKSGCRGFVGFSAGVASTVTSDPSSVANILGFGFDAADSAWTFMHNDGSGTATKEVIGGQAAFANNQGFDAYIFCYPNDTTVYYALYDVNQGTWLCDTSVNSNLPVNTTSIAPMCVVSNGTANTAAGDAAIGINGMTIYTER